MIKTGGSSKRMTATTSDRSRLLPPVLHVTRTFGTIHARGDLRLQTLDDFIAPIHRAISNDGYKDIMIDMTEVSSVMPSVVPPLCSFFRRLLLDKNVDFSLVEPRDANVRSRLHALGLPHFISYRNAKKNTSPSGTAVIQFMNDDERIAAVDRVINTIMRSVQLSPSHISSLDWAVNEITDNVMTHAASRVGGFLICNRVPGKPFIEFTVADGGVGVRRSLGLSTDEIAVEKAIQEGVTRNDKTNQGNGLYGTYRLALESHGIFVLRSGHGDLFVAADGSCKVRREPRPFGGTFVVCQVNYEQPDLIERALVFKGRGHLPPFDYLERHHEREEKIVSVAMKDTCKTFGSRVSGIEARSYILNILSAYADRKIVLDFTNISVISSSFADEVFGKLFVELGPMRYMRSIHLNETVPVVEGLIDRAITMRSRTGL